MATIQSVFGKYDAAKSKSGNLWVLLADEQSIFEVPEWIPQTKEVSGKFAPPTPGEIELPKPVTWTLKDKSQKEILHALTSNVLQKLPITINKQYSGSYSYYLEAALDGTKEKAGIYIQGYAPSLITVFKWGKDNTYKDKGELKQGENIYVNIETEGLNGDKLKLEIYDQTEKKTVKELDTECVNGIIEASFNTLGIVKLEPNINKTLCIKLKLTSGVYIKDTSSKEELATFTINDKVQAVPQVPQNITPLKVGKPDKNITTTGFISLERVAVDTKYDVCHDEVANFSDYKNFWILKGNKSPVQKIEYYHWIKKSDLGDPTKGGAKEDLTKPSILPVTLSSEDQLTFTAVFKTGFPIDARVRVRDREKQYTFTIENYPKSVAKGTEHEIKFTSQTTPPYKGTVQYFPNLELIFDYSLDGKSWTPLGSARFCLYLTIGKPGYGQLSLSSFGGIEYTAEDGNRRIINKVNNNESILETFLYLGCKFGKGAKNADEIFDKVFNHIKSLDVERARVKHAMGYWRNTSSLHLSNMHFRGVRYLLKYGEARCGEWSSFLQDICKIQSDSLFTGKFEDFIIEPKGNIDSNGYTNTLFLVKEWHIKDPLAPVDVKQKAQDLKNVPLNLFWDHVFTKYGDKYFDPSYGLSSATVFADNNALLKDYSDKALSGILYCKADPKNPVIDAISYKPQTGKYIDPFNAYSLTTVKMNNYKYKTVIANMQNELTKYIVPI